MERNPNVTYGEMLNRLIRNISKGNRMIFFYFAIYTIAASIYPFFSIIMPKLLISELTLVAGASLNKILIITLGYFLLTSIFGFIRTFIHDLAYPMITKLRIDYLRDVFDKIISMDYKYAEDANFLEENNRAMRAASSNDVGIEGIYHKLFESMAIF